MVIVKIKEKETIESLLRRFKKHLQRSGVLNLAREKRYYKKDASKNLNRKSAVRREEIRKERDLLRKKGKLDIN